MQSRSIVFGLVFFRLLCVDAQAQQISFHPYEKLAEPPLRYVVYKTIDSLQVDGKALELSWEACAWSDYFVDIEGDQKPLPAYKTRFKMLWNDAALYIFAELEEPHVWAHVQEHDQVVFYDNDFEVFIDTDGDTQSYFEIEVNALKTVFDLFLAKPYRSGGSALISWNAPGLKVGVSVDGTCNNPDDRDKTWSVEMAIPFKSVSMGNYTQVPVDGTTWRINFSRVQWDVDIHDHTYTRRINPATQAPYPEHNWVWSPQGLVNMHYPERWGCALFSSSVAGSATVPVNAPHDNAVERYLWLVYYKQVAYRQAHNTFAKKLSTLGVTKKYFVNDGIRYVFALQSLADQFSASITNVLTGQCWQIDQHGVISKKSKVKPLRS